MEKPKKERYFLQMTNDACDSDYVEAGNWELKEEYIDKWIKALISREVEKERKRFYDIGLELWDLAQGYIEGVHPTNSEYAKKEYDDFMKEKLEQRKALPERKGGDIK